MDEQEGAYYTRTLSLLSPASIELSLNVAACRVSSDAEVMTYGPAVRRVEGAVRRVEGAVRRVEGGVCRWGLCCVLMVGIDQSVSQPIDCESLVVLRVEG